MALAITNMPIFKQFDKKHLQSTIKDINYGKNLDFFTYKFVPRHKILFSYGDEGDNFYFIIRGSAFLLRPKFSEPATTHVAKKI